MMDMLVEKSRLKAERNAKASYALIDSQSSKTIYSSEDHGIDGVKIWVFAPMKVIARLF